VPVLLMARPKPRTPAQELVFAQIAAAGKAVGLELVYKMEQKGGVEIVENQPIKPDIYKL
jgi:hypothetical protein